MKSEHRCNLRFKLVLESLIHEIKVSVVGHCKKDIIIKGQTFYSLLLHFLSFSFSILPFLLLSVYFITPHIITSRD